MHQADLLKKADPLFFLIKQPYRGQKRCFYRKTAVLIEKKSKKCIFSRKKLDKMRFA